MVRKPATVQDLVALSPAVMDLRRAFDSAFPFAADTSGEGGSGDSGSGNGGDSGDGTGESGDGTDGTGAGTDDGKDVKDPEKKKLSDEAAQHRNRAKAAEKERDDALAKLRELEDKDKSESEKNARDAAEEKAKREKAEAKLKEQAVKLAFYDSGAAALFHDASDALRLLDLSDVKPDEDGEVDLKVIKAKADTLLKEKPYLAKQEGDDAENFSGGIVTGSPSGKANNGKKSKDQVDYEALAKKFPALRR